MWAPCSLGQGTRTAVASHDSKVIEYAKALARERGVAADRFEFQLLYGIRRDLAVSLAAQRYRVRQYVPFGTRWYRYFMRRLAERPANLAFFLRALFSMK
jgi:proline dehydrogenase